MLIRKFQEKDAFKVSYLIKQSMKKVFPGYYDDGLIKNMLSKNGVLSVKKRAKKRDMYVYEENNKVLGVMGKLDNEIKTAYVNPRYHGKGIGKKLYLYLEKLIKKKGFVTIFVLSSLPAKGFYEKCGFKLIKKFTNNHDGLMIDEYLMKKKL